MCCVKEYVVVMVGNKKSMGQIAHDLVDFIGEEHAQAFVQWLSEILPSFEQSKDQEEVEEEDLSPPKSTSPVKKMVNLTGKTSTVVSLSQKPTVRSLNRSGEDIRDVLARRSQRFGVEKLEIREKTEEKSVRGNKRKAETREIKQQRPGSGRLSQLLGPPVNEDQAELDARDSLHSNKRKKAEGRDKDRENRRSTNANHRRRQDDRSRERSRERGDVPPPLPPHSPPPEDPERSKDGRDTSQREGRGPIPPPHGFHGGPPPSYGGYGPPFGPPMYYPPPYGHMPPYGMGFPPHPHHSGGPRGPMMDPKPHFSHGPRGVPRPTIPFQNRKWVNPNAVKAEESAAASSEGTEGSSEPTTEGASTYRSGPVKAPKHIPRNPYYSQVPRFQNKTWVRPDTVSEDILDKSLPKTPPPEAIE